MTFSVVVNTNRGVATTFRVDAPTVPEAFALIPRLAADRGLALINDGEPVTYQVRVVG